MATKKSSYSAKKLATKVKKRIVKDVTFMGRELLTIGKLSKKIHNKYVRGTYNKGIDVVANDLWVHPVHKGGRWPLSLLNKLKIKKKK